VGTFDAWTQRIKCIHTMGLVNIGICEW